MLLEDVPRFSKYVEGLMALGLRLEPINEGKAWFLESVNGKKICKLVYDQNKAFEQRFDFELIY